MTDGTSGGRGITYESRMCMLFVVRGYMRGLTNFRLRYQVEEAGKFDDIVFDEGGGNYQVFQLKHKEKEGKHKISNSQLFHDTFNADYNLLKYVKSVIDINTSNSLGGEVKMAFVCTNIDFDFQKDCTKLSLVSNRKDWYEKLTDIQLDTFEPDENAIFSFPAAKYYKFDNDPKIVQILKRQSETVAKEMFKKLEKQKNTNVEKYENQQNKLREDTEATAKQLQEFTEDGVLKGLKKIVYAVRQPNDMELEELIKKEIKSHFKLQDADTVYTLLENKIMNWCNTKNAFDGETNLLNSHIIQFNDAETFFQKSVKNVSFCVILSTFSFTGRTDELKRIREKLKENQNLIVSQSVKISGLGGIGKTELTKQFIKKFGQSDFYGRVIWIEAESDESVKKSFKELAERIDIQDRENKSTKIIIDQIFNYFYGVKVLFVFDNFDKNTEEKQLVIYCRKRASDPLKKHRPYLIFTSRNRECLPGVSSLDLGVLTKDDANELIQKGLKVTNYTNEDVEELAKTLQYFPLALQQAIAYINRQNEIKRVSGGRYVIQDYLTEFIKKTEELLNYPHTNDFEEFERTTWITWNVTFEAISKDKINGANAIKVLQCMSYLYADKIDAKMFLPLFENDSTRNGKAFLLLEKYSIITRIGVSTYQIHRLVQVVVQSKFKKEEREILNITWKLISPELYESNVGTESWRCYENLDYVDRKYGLMRKCTLDQIIHYNNLASYTKRNDRKTEFNYFVDDLNQIVLSEAFYKDDIDKINKLQLSSEALTKFAERNINFRRRIYSEKAVKYLIDNEYLKVNTEKLVDLIEEGSLDMFKYIVKKGANLKNLVFGPIELISDIIQGKSNSLMGFIENNETEILEECLFFAFLFNQDRIVELLININFSPDDTVCRQLGYAPIKAAVELNYRLKILFKVSDKPKVKKKVASILLDVFHDEKLYNYNNCLELLLKKYLEVGGDINDKHYCNNGATFLTVATDPQLFKVSKIGIVNFLLDNGADPCLLSNERKNAFFNVIIIKSRWEYNHYLNDIYEKMKSKFSKKKFMSCIKKRLKNEEIFDANSDDLFQYINDINFRETFLINVVRLLENTRVEEDTIIILLEAGVNVDAKDNDGKNALYYALNLKSKNVFKFLLTKVSSVNEEILLKAIKDDKYRYVEELLKTHFKLNHIFEGGKTVLEVAFENLSSKTMIFLHPKIKELNLENAELARIYKTAKNALIKYIKNEDDIEYEDVNVFLEISGDVNAIDEDENNVLHYAADLEDDEIFMYLLEKGSKVLEKTFEHAIKNDKLKIVKAIIPKYFELNYTFEDKKTILEIAFENLSLKTMLFLHPKIKKINLEEGELERIYKKAPMALVKYIKNFNYYNGLEHLEVFLEISADVNAIDENGNNALHYASDLPDDRAFFYLLSKGSTVLEQTLEYVITHDKLEIVKAIIPTYFKKDHRFTNGWNSGLTAINLATELKSYKVYKVLKYLTELSAPIV